ncbi:MAG TPA: molybdopterin cofactor-binding domain-containing protein [Longimicrobiales bacterium]|jgi:isoquinoline 1-oxidoreductase beta subunit
MKTRREFVAVMAGAGGALVLGVDLRPLWSRDVSQERDGFRPNAWVRIDADGSVTVVVGKSEMGQGVRTGLPMIAAEELDVPLERVRLEQASPGPDYTDLGTGGSSSTTDSWGPLREAGAAARAMLVAAAAERWGVTPDACRTEDGAVLHPATGRRLGYGELATDAARQPVPERPVLKARAEYRLLGTPRNRLDGPDIISGQARYGLDVRRPGMRYAVVARSPVLGGRVASFDGARALRVNGVVDVIEIPTGVAVVAEHTWAAIKGRDALEIQWRESPHAAFDTERHREALEAATVAPGHTIRRDGRGREAFDDTTRHMEAVYHYPFAAHGSVEPVNCTALVDGDRCEVWSPTQTPNAVQVYGSRLLGVPRENVTVHVTLLGGAFGRRLGWDFDMEALEIARARPGTPVQLVWTREDDLRYGYFQAASAHRMRAGFGDGGRVVAWEHRKASTPHQARGVPTAAQLQDPDWLIGSAWGVYDTPYAFPAFEATYAVVEAPVPIGPWRSVFSPPSVFARECFLDEVAQALGRDPLELRLDLLDSSDAAIEPTFTVNGDLVDRRRMRAVFETVAREGGWGRNVTEGRALGLAGNVFHTGTYMAYVVEVSLRPDAPSGELPFTVHRVTGALDCGLVINPNALRQQVESGVVWGLSNMKSEMTWRDGTARESNYHQFRVVTMAETPPVIDLHLVGTDADEPHGVGEPVVCPFAPAVANALSRLVGRRVRRLPVRAADLA